MGYTRGWADVLNVTIVAGGTAFAGNTGENAVAVDTSDPLEAASVRAIPDPTSSDAQAATRRRGHSAVFACSSKCCPAFRRSWPRRRDTDHTS
jgi:hypothetical protein